jgi:PAS domain S-box-containing protein
MATDELKSLKSLVDILQHNKGTKQEFLDYALSHAIRLTESSIGYIYHYAEETGEFILNSWSKGVLDACAVMEPQTRYQLDKTGIWGEAVRQRKPIIVNDFTSPNPLRKGYPHGHVPLSRFMTIPVFAAGRIVAVVGVANRKTDYTDTDVLHLTLLMDSIWKVTTLMDKEEELRISNRELAQRDLIFNLFLEHSPIYVFFKDSEMRSLYLSRNFETMLGRPLKELLNKNMFDLFPHDFAHKMVEDDKKIAAEGKQVTLEENFNNRTYTTIKFPIMQQDSPPMLAGFTIDITEERRAKNEIVKAANEWQSTFDSSSDGIFILDIDSRITRYNRKAIEMFHLENREITGHFCWELTHGTQEPIPGCPAHKAKTTLKRESLELEMAGRWFLVTADPIIREEGELGGFVHTVSDITDRKTAADRIAENRDYLSAVLDSMNQALFIHDGDTGKIIDVNRRMCELYGYTKEEALLLDTGILSQGSAPYSSEEIQKWVSRVKTSGPQTFEWMARHKDGHFFWVEISITFCLINAKPRLITTITDIDQRKKIEAAMNNSQRLESLGILAGGIAHDFNNLMGGVFGYLSLALHKSSDPEVTVFLEKSMLAKDRAQALTRQLLTFAKGGSPVRQPECFFPFIAETVNFALSGSNLLCEFNIDPQLWNGNFDRNQIGQVFDNLIINAKQAMPLGGKITVTAANIHLEDGDFPLLIGGDYVRISVQDTGTGIPAEHLSRIFDPFFTTKQTGSGLGLATVYSIIRQHDGVINVESKPAKGSVFNVYLPADHSGCSEAPSEKSIAHRGEGRILVMDDETIILELVKDTLMLSGYDADCAENGSAALNLFKTALSAGNPYTAVIVDLTIPGSRGGIEIAEEMRKLDAEVPIFVSSGYSDNPVMAAPEDYGFTASIPKPFSVAEFLNIVAVNIKKKKTDCKKECLS